MKNICQKIVVVTLVTIFLLSTNIALAVTQQEINAQKDKQSQINSQINDAEKKHQEIEAKKSETMKQVESISSQIETYESQINVLQGQINETNTKIAEAQKKLDENQKEHDKKEELLKKRLVAVYEAGETSFLEFLLTSQSLTEFISNYYLVSEVTQMDTELLEKLEKQKQEIEKAKKEIEESKQQLTTAKAEKEGVASKLKTSKSEKDKYVAQLSEEEKELEKEIQALKQANAQIANEIKLAEQKYKEQLAQLQQGSSGNTSAGSGFFIRPVNGGYISADGYYPSSGRFHGAIDYAIPSGTPVYAAAAGVVMTTANLATSYGTYVVIRHANGLQSYYAHGTYGSICVSPGQIVKQGQKIMNSGNSGNSQGPHLHFEVRKSPYNYNGYSKAYGQDSRVNPSAYM